MRAMEESGSLTYFSILFEANSFSELLSRMDFISTVMKYDKDLENAYIAARENVETVKAEYEATLAEQEDKKVELEEKKAELEKQIVEAEAVIASLEKDIEKYKTEYAANESQEAAIRSQIDAAVAALEKQQKEAAAAGASVVKGTGQFVWPVPSCTSIGSGFGYRVHPIFGDLRFHSGVDIPAAAGATIIAADSGTVVTAVYSSSYGNYVVISHGSGNTTLYAHMSSRKVSVGQYVNQGDVIGITGSTGNSTGPHLHYEVMIKGVNQNPLDYLPGYIARW